MSKKGKMFEYLMDNIFIDLNGIEEIKQQPTAQIDFVGGVERWYLASYANYYPECKNAIRYAGYKYPESDRTWRTVEAVKDSIVKQKLELIAKKIGTINAVLDSRRKDL